jgi:hypothetical protein
MAEMRWTPAMVEERLIEAADILKRLPAPRIQGFYSLWPAIAPSFDDLVGQTPRPMSRAWPAPDAIDRMEASFDWLKWLEPVDRKIVSMRASGERWKNVCWKVGLSRPAAWQHWAAALCVIAMKLNGERVPKHRSRVRAAEMRRRAGVGR